MNKKTYIEKLQIAIDLIQDCQQIQVLSNEIFNSWKAGKQVFICGNGGSAANAIHLANDFIYG